MKHDNLFKPQRLSWVNNYSLWLFLFSLSDYSVKSIDLFSSFLVTLTQLQWKRNVKKVKVLSNSSSIHFSFLSSREFTWNYGNFTFSLQLKTEREVLVRSRVSMCYQVLCFKIGAFKVISQLSLRGAAEAAGQVLLTPQPH